MNEAEKLLKEVGYRAAMKQRGFYNLDFMPLLIAIGVVIFIIGIGAYPIIGWLWSVLKPLLHEVTK